MATSSRNAGVLAIQVVLGIAIVVLSYFLYHAIRDPYLAVERAEQLTQQTRNRMNQVRIALRVYNERNNRFPGTLDSLVQFIQSDSLVTARTDSLFGESFNADSFYVSPRPPHSTFEYAINDTSRVKIYMLKDPGSDDQIGTLQPDITQVHAASWE